MNYGWNHIAWQWSIFGADSDDESCTVSQSNVTTCSLAFRTVSLDKGWQKSSELNQPKSNLEGGNVSDTSLPRVSKWTNKGFQKLSGHPANRLDSDRTVKVAWRSQRSGFLCVPMSLIARRGAGRSLVEKRFVAVLHMFSCIGDDTGVKRARTDLSIVNVAQAASSN